MNKEKRVFISLPIMSRKEATREEKIEAAYDIAERKRVDLNAQGYFGVTPFMINPIGVERSEAECIGRCIQWLLGCDCIYFCSGWRHAEGCLLELECARIFGKEIIGDEL